MAFNEDLYNKLYKLKNLERRGWLLREVKDPITNTTESVAEHSFSMCMLALEIINKKGLRLNQEKVLKMCLFHDLSEIECGDITPFDNITKEQKFKQERTAIKKISNLFGSREVEEIWLEFEENITDEAKFVKIIDKLDAVKQAKVYSQKLNRPEIFEEFYNNAFEVIKDYIEFV